MNKTFLYDSTPGTPYKILRPHPSQVVECNECHQEYPASEGYMLWTGKVNAWWHCFACVKYLKIYDSLSTAHYKKRLEQARKKFIKKRDKLLREYG